MQQDPIAFSFFNEIGIIHQLASAKFDQVLPRGMTRAQFGILNHFVRLGHASRSPAQLASAFQITRSTMSSTLARMAHNGLIIMTADIADGRSKNVRLTDKGREMREHCVAAVMGLLPQLHALIDEAKLSSLLPHLTELRIALDEARN